MYKRQIFEEIIKRISEKRKFIQVLSGPRQTGKTTLANQLIETVPTPVIYISADEPANKTNSWIEQQWEIARTKFKTTSQQIILIFDEIQKIHNWSETIKRLWDEDTIKGNNIYLILLGSSQLLVQKGLTESLAGRFEIIPVSHWTYLEMKTAFNFSIEEYIYYGGYPGSAELINNPARWKNYILDSLIEPTLSKDIMMITRVDKPALLRRLFEFGCLYSGQILSYQKMLGQLQDAGNTTTLSHYLKLLQTAGLITGLSKYSGSTIRQKSSSPKLQVLNTALMSAYLQIHFSEIQNNREIWGRLVESAIGAHLYNTTDNTDIKLFYWIAENKEVDFILQKNTNLIAIEVKSGQYKNTLHGIEFFSKKYNVSKKILVGDSGIPIPDFLSLPPEQLFD